MIDNLFKLGCYDFQKLLKICLNLTRTVLKEENYLRYSIAKNKNSSAVTDSRSTVIRGIADRVVEGTDSDFMVHYVHRRLAFLTSGEVGADPALRTSTASTLAPRGKKNASQPQIAI